MDTKKLLIGIIALSVLIVLGAYGLKNLSKTKQTSQGSAQPNATTTSAVNKEGKKIEVPIPAAPKFSDKAVVNLTKTGFDPTEVTVKTGALIQWINKSGADATVNSADHPTHKLYPTLNLGRFPDGSSVSLIFDKAGTYKYHNHLIPEQTGTVTVK